MWRIAPNPKDTMIVLKMTYRMWKWGKRRNPWMRNILAGTSKNLSINNLHLTTIKINCPRVRVYNLNFRLNSWRCSWKDHHKNKPSQYLINNQLVLRQSVARIHNSSHFRMNWLLKRHFLSLERRVFPRTTPISASTCAWTSKIIVKVTTMR